MKAELIMRVLHLQEEELDLALEYCSNISKIFTQYIHLLPEEIKEEYIRITRPFIDKYNILLGEDGKDEEEEN